MQLHGPLVVDAPVEERRLERKQINLQHYLLVRRVYGDVPYVMGWETWMVRREEAEEAHDDSTRT